MLAGLRMILGPKNRIVSVSAQTQQLQNYLPPIDTLDAVTQTELGATGTISLSWGSRFTDSLFEFECEKGTVKIQFDDVMVNDEVHHIEFDGKGVVPEVREFAETILRGDPVAKRQSPEEALADLSLLEQMMRSGEHDGDRMMLHFQVRDS